MVRRMGGGAERLGRSALQCAGYYMTGIVVVCTLFGLGSSCPNLESVDISQSLAEGRQLRTLATAIAYTHSTLLTFQLRCFLDQAPEKTPPG